MAKQGRIQGMSKRQSAQYRADKARRRDNAYTGADRKAARRFMPAQCR